MADLNIPVTGKRQVAVPAAAIVVPFQYKDLAALPGDIVVMRRTIDALAPFPASFNVANCTWGTVSTTVTTTAPLGFANVKPGDALESATPADFTTQRVVSVAENKLSLILSAAPTGNVSSPGLLTFTPPTHDATDLIVTLQTVVSDDFKATNVLRIYQFDGTLPDSDGDGDDEASPSNIPANGRLIETMQFTADLNIFYANKRVNPS